MIDCGRLLRPYCCMRTKTQPSKAYQTFIASMAITLEDWREGNGYDLDALDEVTGEEREELVKVLAERLKSAPDWRQAEALGAIGTPAAVKALQSAMKTTDRELRIHV